ncbi:gamma-glutamylcyclotransferase [Mycobacterium sp. NPDC049093]
MCDENGGARLGLPLDIEKPLFVYGNLKPGELGYDLISKQVLGRQTGELPGDLWVRDGVPLANLNSSGGRISGYLLTLSPDGYDNVGKCEPATYYQWSTATCVEPAGLEVNVLGPVEGLTADRGGGDALHEPWTTALDPLFTYGLAAVAATLRSDGRMAFEGNFYDPSTWTRFYRLQAAYMLACSILERLAFWIASNDGPTAAVNAVGRQAEFVAAVQQIGVQIPQHAVHRADNPRKKVVLNRPDQFAKWAYQIRSNLMHRGKSAWSEANLVRTALIDLHDVLRVYLLTKVPKFRKAWTESEPKSQPYCWRIKAEFDASSGD